MDKFIDLTPENIENEHLCCIIRSKKTHPGVEAKRAWLAERLTEGHIFRKLDEKATVFIEYAPLEKAWVPIEGDNYIYIYCLWVLGDYREQRLRQEADGILHCRRQGPRALGSLYARLTQAKGVALGSGICKALRLRGGRHGRRIRAARPLV